VGYVFALVMLLSVSFFRFVVLLFPLWVAAVSIAILLLPASGDSGRQRTEGIDR
jgi:hypothetical protein